MTMLGVPGRLTHRTTKPGQATGLWCNQRWISEARSAVAAYGKGCLIRAEVRFDDECNNGHNTFAITGTVWNPTATRRHEREVAGGCLHEDIAKLFPELAPLIKWHLTSSDGPMHYIANTIYHASNRDHRGLLKGEKRQLVNGKTKEKCWEQVVVDEDGVPTKLDRYYDGPTPPEPQRLEWKPWYVVGEGKERNFDHARSSAVWPEATDEQLSADPEELKRMLTERHPALVAAFKEAMLGAGFLWSPEDFGAVEHQKSLT